ncbi:MAG TPA: YecA family protein [Albitalea sp.]|uniref:YecA/YgfB family protein n=1 Tax=Piscinibacter sp. TaxID=1903157 RepID=UPI002ED5462B
MPKATPPAVTPLVERDIDELQALLDAVPSPLEPLDVSMLDGFLCGLLVQPQRVPETRWLPHVTDADGRPLPPRFDPTRLHALARSRHAELDQAIGARQWFDPWVFEMTGDDDAPPSIDAVYPWVAGFATAMELFPALMQTDAAALLEPLALLYRHLDPDDLEDADDLLAEIDSLEPPADLTEAVEGLVRATLLLADIGRPVEPRAAPRSARHRRPAGQRSPRR